MSDLLDMEKINSTPQPLWVEQHGQWWPVHDIDVQTGMMRIDACGILDVIHFGGVMRVRDDSGHIHDADEFYLEEGSAQ